MKKILFILVLTLIGCKKIAPVVIVPVNSDVFSVSQSSVDNGQELQFNLTKSGVYTLTLVGCRKVAPVIVTPVVTTNIFTKSENTIDC